MKTIIILLILAIGISAAQAKQKEIVLPYKQNIGGGDFIVGRGNQSSGPFINVSATCIMNTLYYLYYNRMAISHNNKSNSPFYCDVRKNGIIVYYED